MTAGYHRYAECVLHGGEVADHYYPRSANQGFFWWEIDLSFYVLRLLQALRIVWDVRTPPKHIRDAHLQPSGPIHMQQARQALL